MLCSVAGCTFATAATVGASAQTENFPAKPITMIVPFTAGGADNILARILSRKLEQKWGRGFLAENRVGAGGVIGAVAMQKTASNGYTLMIAPSAAMAVNVTLFQSLMLPVRSSPLAELQSYLRAEIAQWGEVVRKARIAGSQ